MSAVDPSLASQCLDLSQALVRQGLAFSLSLTIGSEFTFSLDTRKIEEQPSPMARKYTSPSTQRRNVRRQQEFLKKKAEASPNTPETTVKNPEAEGSWSSKLMTDSKSVKLKIKKVPPKEIPQVDGIVEEETYTEIETAQPEDNSVSTQTSTKSIDAQTQTSETTDTSHSTAKITQTLWTIPVNYTYTEEEEKMMIGSVKSKPYRPPHSRHKNT